MRVFSACVKMMRQHRWVFITNISIFAVLLMCMTFIGDSSMYGNFNEEKPDYAFINRDGESALVKGLSEVLKKDGTCEKLEDSQDAMMDAGFYGAVDGIFIVPEGFTEAFLEDGEKLLKFWQRPSAAAGYYLKSVAEQYLSLAKLNRKIFPEISEEELAQSVAAAMAQETEVVMKRYTDGAVVSEKIRFYQRFMPYVLLMACLSCVSTVFLNFRRPEIRMRNLCSPIRPVSMAAQKFFFTCLTAVLVWGIINIMGFAVCWKEWQSTDWRIAVLFTCNNFMAMLFSISFSLLCSCAVQSATAQPFVANIASLTMCFLGGVFVPLELLSEGLIRAAKLFPTYWYEENVAAVCGLAGFGRENLLPVWRNFALQAGFAAAIFVVYLIVNKYMEKAAEAYGAVKTEVEL